MKNNKGMSLVVLIILILVILVLVSFGVAMYVENNQTVESNVSENIVNKENNTTQVENITETIDTNISEGIKINNTTDANEKVKLTDNELAEFTKNLNKIENNGFIIMNYTNIENANYSEVLYNGAGIDIQNEVIIKEYEETTAEQGMGVPVKKLKAEEIDMFLRKKTGIIFNLKEILSKVPYSEKYDAYYFVGGDTNYLELNCMEGYKIGNRYVVTGKFTNPIVSEEGKDINGFTVTLISTENGYRFVSNELK